MPTEAAGTLESLPVLASSPVDGLTGTVQPPPVSAAATVKGTVRVTGAWLLAPWTVTLCAPTSKSLGTVKVKARTPLGGHGLRAEVQRLAGDHG